MEAKQPQQRGRTRLRVSPQEMVITTSTTHHLRGTADTASGKGTREDLCLRAARRIAQEHCFGWLLTANSGLCLEMEEATLEAKCWVQQPAPASQ